MDIATTRPKWPKGQFGEKNLIISSPKSSLFTLCYQPDPVIWSTLEAPISVFHLLILYLLLASNCFENKSCNHFDNHFQLSLHCITSPQFILNKPHVKLKCFVHISSKFKKVLFRSSLTFWFQVSSTAVSPVQLTATL